MASEIEKPRVKQVKWKLKLGDITSGCSQLINIHGAARCYGQCFWQQIEQY